MTKSKSDGPRPNSEVPERAKRRRFSAEYKLRVLQEADRCGSGEVGALLRREGLYSSHLTAWRQQRNEGALASFSRKRGRKAKRSAEQIELDRVLRENCPAWMSTGKATDGPACPIRQDPRARSPWIH